MEPKASLLLSKGSTSEPQPQPNLGRPRFTGEAALDAPERFAHHLCSIEVLRVTSLLRVPDKHDWFTWGAPSDLKFKREATLGWSQFTLRGKCQRVGPYSETPGWAPGTRLTPSVVHVGVWLLLRVTGPWGVWRAALQQIRDPHWPLQPRPAIEAASRRSPRYAPASRPRREHQGARSPSPRRPPSRLQQPVPRRPPAPHPRARFLE